MFNSFLVSFRLKNTYRVNTIIYSLKQIPIIKKILPSSLYKNHGLKIFANILSFLWELISLFLGKLIYIPLMILFPMTLLNKFDNETLLQIIFFLTLIGALYNTGMLSPSRDKYYAVILMKMDAKDFGVSNYIYVLMRHFIGFLICFIFFGLNFQIHLPIELYFLIPAFICSTKLIVIQYCLRDFIKGHKIHNENNLNKYTMSFACVCLLCAYGLLYLNIIFPYMVFVTIGLITIVLGIHSLIYVLRYQEYHRMYHTLLSSAATLLNASSTQLVNDTYRNMITLDTQLTSQKNGFEYFNELFVKRHKRILWRSAKRQAYGIIFLTGLVIVGLYTFIDVKNSIQLFTTMLPFFVFIMYFMNTTRSVTQAMFVNCDHSMLTYSFYRQPQHILALFKIRLRDMIKINLLPASLLGIGVAIILYLSGGQSQLLNCIVSFVSIVSMSVFFSTHYLMLYYLFQPYNAFTEVKNPVYTIITSLTYVVCYLFTRLKLATLIFGMTTIVFSIAYCLIACWIVYKKAGDTFKIHN